MLWQRPRFTPTEFWSETFCKNLTFPPRYVRAQNLIDCASISGSSICAPVFASPILLFLQIPLPESTHRTLHVTVIFRADGVKKAVEDTKQQGDAATETKESKEKKECGHQAHTGTVSGSEPGGARNSFQSQEKNRQGNVRSELGRLEAYGMSLVGKTRAE